MRLYVVRHGRVRYRRLGQRVQLGWRILVCEVYDHDWGPWRRETRDWFEYIDAPTRWGDWRHCRRCSVSEWVTERAP